jgi:hypothetical protein
MNAPQTLLLLVRLEDHKNCPYLDLFHHQLPYPLIMGGHLNLQLTNDINLVHILEPYCSNAMPEPNEDVDSVRRYLSKVSSPTLWCRVSACGCVGFGIVSIKQ